VSIVYFYELTIGLTQKVAIVSIRAYGVEESFKSKSMAHINHYSRPSIVFYNLNRWVDIRIDLLGSIFQTGLTAYLVYMTEQRASTIGFSLNMAGKC
jgi:hypothetical protein